MSKNLLLLLAIIAFVCGVTYWLNRDAPIRSVPLPLEETAEKDFTPAPDFKFTTLDGRNASLSDLKGKVVILHFWATWCPPCLTEFPKLIKASAGFKKDIVLLAVSSDRSDADIRKFTGTYARAIEGAGNIYLIRDKDRAITHDLYQSFAYPETIIIDDQGRMIRKIAGDADWTSEEMTRYLVTLTSSLANRPAKTLK